MLEVPNDWLVFIEAGEYEKLAEVTAYTPYLEKKLITALWHSRALRSLGKGDAANTALLTTVRNKFKASTEEIGGFAEELVQSAFYEDASRLAQMLAKAGAIEADYVTALLSREREDWVQCNSALKKLQNKGHPWQTLAKLQAAWAMMRQGRHKLSQSILDAESLQQSNPIVSKLFSRIDLASGRWQDAISRLEQVAKVQPLDWEWPALLASAMIPSLVNKNKDEQLVSHEYINKLFELSFSRQPRQPEALFNRAQWRLLNNDEVGAKDDCNSALAIKPWFDRPVLIWVEKAVAGRNYAEAEKLLKEVRRQCDTPRRAGAALDLMRLQASGKQDLTTVALELVKKYPDDATVLRTAGAAFQSSKKYDQATKCYKNALELVPEDDATRNNLALLLRDQGDLEAAISTLRSFVNGANNTILANYAMLLMQYGDRLEAEALFRTLLLKEPHNSTSLRGLAEIEFDAGEDQKAWDLSNRSVQADSKNPLSWITIARVAERHKGLGFAIELLLQGEKQAVPNREVREALFKTWRNLLNRDDLNKKIFAWASLEPEEEKYWLMAADVAYDFSDFDCCEKMLIRAQDCNPEIVSEMLIRFYLNQDRQGLARRVAEQLVRANPQRQTNWALLAEVLYKQERFVEAHKAVDAGLRIDPTRISMVRLKVGFHLGKEEFKEAIYVASQNFVANQNKESLSLLIGANRRARDFDSNVKIIESMLTRDPKDQMLRLMHASALERVGRHEDALNTLERLYQDEPENFNVVQQYTKSLVSAGRLAETITVLQKLAETSDYRPNLVLNIIEVMNRNGNSIQALALLDKALLRSPSHLELWLQKTQLLKQSDDVVAEAETWREVIARFPVRHWASRATHNLVRLGLNEYLEKGLNSWRIAEPSNVQPWWLAFEAAKEMKNDFKALAFLEKIELLRGPNSKIYSERAAILQEGWQLSAAIKEVRKAIRLRPSEPYLYEQLLHIMAKAGSFDEFDRLMHKLEHMLGDNRYSIYSNFFFNINCHPTWSGSEVWRFYKDWYQRVIDPDLPPPIKHKNTPNSERRLRIGYVSPDLRRHAVAYFSEPLLIKHDRNQFELYAYAHLEPKKADEYTDRFKKYFHHWTEIRNMSDDELERKIRADGIDILIDLAGHTIHNRLKVFIKRPSPVQASWLWGAGQTTGLPQIDYLVGDFVSTPPEFEPLCAEQLARLPEPGFCFMPAHDVLDPVPLPCLENGFITFGVLARPLRTNRETVAVWAKILKRVPNALLRFDHVPYAEPEVQQRLISYFVEHEIAAERLIFLNTRPHWRVYQEIDIQLDPFPAGSSTTASEGLYMERLLVTLRSRPPMGRMVDSQLSAMDLALLCSAETPEEYINKAVELATNVTRLVDLSKGLRDRMKASRLMDYEAYGRDAAVLYRSMWREWCKKTETQTDILQVDSVDTVRHLS
jgi:predicted O-linked N-acetylglucosamine transferase (SPINDLY family)